MDHKEYLNKQLEHLKILLALLKIGPSELATLINGTKTHVSGVLTGSKNVTPEFLYNATMALGYHPDAVTCTSNTCRKVINDILPAEIPVYIKPALRTRIKKS